MKPLEPDGSSAGSDTAAAGEARDLPHPASRVPRRERELKRHRDELLRATDRVLRSKSLHELTIVDIAAEAEFSVGYIYKLFPNKEELVATLIRSKLRELRGIVEESLSRFGTWHNRTETLAREMLAWLDRGTAAYTAGVTPNLREFATDHSAVAPDLVEFMTFYTTSVDHLFSESVRSGALAEPRPGMIARTFRALIAGFAEERIQGRIGREPAPEVARHIVRVLKRTFAVEGGGA
jgi:AcrR family transcriptional regulator